MPVFIGTPGSDILSGTAGADTLDGAGGTDTLNAGDGDDLILIWPGLGEVDGGAGIDTLSLANGRAETSRVDLNLDGPQDVWSEHTETLTLTGIENVFGHATAANLLIGDAAANRLVGGGGSDTVIGGGGDDRLEGGGGSDTAVFGATVSSFAFTALAGVWTVRDVSSGLSLGTDIATGFETFQFADRTVNLLISDGAIEAAARNILRDPGPWGVLVANTVMAPSAAVGQILGAAAATSSVAILSYQFFTGGTPSAGGMDYLVSPTGPNAANLNGAYYQTFNLENRYINFAVNLGKAGEGRAAFEAAYGAKTLFEATRTAYGVIFGGEPSDAKLHAILDPTVDLGGMVMTRGQYFAYYGADGPDGLGAKAAMVGWLLAEGVKADLGVYARSNDAYLADLVDGGPYAVDLIGAYGRPEFVYDPD